MSSTVSEPDLQGTMPCPSDEDFDEISNFLTSKENFLDDLRKKMESSAKDRNLVVDDLEEKILEEAGGLTWFGLAFKLVGFIKTKSHSIPRSKDNILSFKEQVCCIGDQISELKLSLGQNSDIFKIAAGSLLYTIAMMKNAEQNISDNQCCCSMQLLTWMRIKSPSDNASGEFDKILDELKLLHNHLMIVSLATVEDSISQCVDKNIPTSQGLSIGVDQHVRRIIDQVQKNGVRLVGIYGHAGLGKTTLLNALVIKLRDSGKRCVASVEVGERPDDLRRLQASLLQQLGGGKKEFASTSQGRNALLYHLQKMKHNKQQAKIAIDNLVDIRLIGELFPHSLGKVLPPGTLIIVTSPSLAIINRLDQLCRPAAPHYHYLPYKLPALGALQAKTLFLSYAGSTPVTRHAVVNKFGDVVDQIVFQCDGNPLALKVTGCYFAQEANLSRESWVAILKRMEAADGIDSAEDRMFCKLQVIFDRLEEGLKEIFLDISVFFRGWDLRVVEKLMGQSQMRSLFSQGLISPDDREADSLFGISQWTRYSEYPWKVKLVGMHDLLATIGCRFAQGNRILSEDQTHLPERLLVDGPGNELSNIQGLSLLSCKEAIQGHMLEKMHSLRLLALHDTGIRGHCTKALHNLQFFYWGRTQPSSEVKIPFQMNRIKKLKVLILRANEIDLNLKYPPQLIDLTLIGCNNMEELPDSIAQLFGLLELHLYGCCRLQSLTEGLGNLRALTRFRLENCGGIKELPRSLGNLTNLTEMDISGCHNLSSLTPEIGCLFNLRKLDLSRCKNLTRLPAEIGGLRSLTHLFLGQCPLTSLCPEIGRLRVLEELSLTSCARLERLPTEVGSLVCLERLNLSYCTGLKELPKAVGFLGSLMQLDLSNCAALLKLPEELCKLSALQSLALDNCKLLSQIPEGTGNLISLKSLSLSCCTKLTRLPPEIINGLPSLQVLNLVGCTGLAIDHPYVLKGQLDCSAVHTDDLVLEGRRPINPELETSP